jgi:hypothetical protein
MKNWAFQNFFLFLFPALSKSFVERMRLKVPAQKKIRSDIMLDLAVEAVRGSAKIVRSRNNRRFET